MFNEIPKKTKINLLSYLGDLGGCGYLRIILPSILASQYKFKNEISFEGYYLYNFIRDVNFYNSVTFVLFQRASTEKHLELIKFFKSNIRIQSKTPIIYESDDLLFEIEKWNYAYDFYKDKKQYIEEILQIVDGIIVSTEPLANEYKKFNKKVIVNPNRLCKFIWGEPEFQTLDNKKPSILWAGSQNHFAIPQMKDKIEGGDFGLKLLNFIKKTVNEYEWVLIGGFPNELDSIKDKIKYISWQHILQFPTILKSIKPTLAIAPLEKNKFNECKSNIKMLEYTAAGYASIYSNVYPYKNAYQKASNDDEFIDKIEKMINDKDLRLKTWSKDIETLKGQIFFEELNNLENYVNNYLKVFGKCLPK